MALQSYLFDFQLYHHHSCAFFLAGQNEEQAAVNFFPKLTRVKVSGFPVSWSQWSFTRLTSLSINFMTSYDRPSMDALKYILTINRETLEKFDIQSTIQQFGTLPRNMTKLPTNLQGSWTLRSVIHPNPSGKL